MGMRGGERQPGLTRRGFLAASAALAGACGARGASAPPQAVLELHRESLVLDLHIDTLLWHRLLGYDPTRRHAAWIPASAFAWHVDLPRAAEAGLDAAVLGVVVTPREERPEQLWALKLLARVERGSGAPQMLETLDLLAELAARHSEALVFARSAAQLREAVAAGRFAALAGLEGCHGLEGRIENARLAWQRGLRMLGLVHFQANEAAFPMTEPSFDARGLTPFGFDLLAEAESLPLVVDLAHLNARGVEDALSAATHPCVVSHSACRAVHDDPRNLSDAQLRAVAERGGVVGLAVGRSFLGPGGLDAFAAHAGHLRRVAGEDSIAIGSDWDGAIVPVPGLADVRGLPFLTWRLLEDGWSEAAVRKLLGGNALRVLGDVLG
jgi:membrane dipeptidase